MLKHCGEKYLNKFLCAFMPQKHGISVQINSEDINHSPLWQFDRGLDPRRYDSWRPYAGHLQRPSSKSSLLLTPHPANKHRTRFDKYTVILVLRMRLHLWIPWKNHILTPKMGYLQCDIRRLRKPKRFKLSKNQDKKFVGVSRNNFFLMYFKLLTNLTFREY